MAKDLIIAGLILLGIAALAAGAAAYLFEQAQKEAQKEYACSRPSN